MRSIRISLISAMLIAASATPAAAWDFTCSPKETKDLREQTPTVLMMLDRSGSMDDSDGVIVNTCKVCELAGEYYEVSSATECRGGGTAWSVSDYATQSGGGSGYTYQFDLVVDDAVNDLALSLDIEGDFNGVCEWGEVYADGVLVGELRDGPGCGEGAETFEFSVPATVVGNEGGLGAGAACSTGGECNSGQCTYDSTLGYDACAGAGVVHIEILTSGDGNACGTDGVDECAGEPDSVNLTLSHDVLTYHGTQTWEDPCGRSDKWEQAVTAIDRLTTQSDAADPQYAFFGLGLYHGTSATVHQDCEASNHADIMSVLNGTGPGGYTPTATAIRESMDSACVTPPAVITREQSGDVGTDASNDGWDLSFTFDNVPTESIVVEVEVQGDFNGRCEFARIFVDGVFFDTVQGSDCGSSSTEVFTVPPSFARDGELVIFVDTRGTGETTSSPQPLCSPGSDGVQASCSGANGARVSIIHSNNSPPPGASILINDGAPTSDLAGNTNTAQARTDAIVQACIHRLRAPMFVVGLGAGTDEDYNNVLAAAGGTGECVDSLGNSADPCDDPTNWSALNGNCSGSIQASSGDELLAALEGITAKLVCTFNINFFNSGYTSVPPDPASEYEYLYVEVYDTAAAQYQRIAHQDSSTASPAGEGWRFTGEARTFIEFSDYYCANVQAYAYSSGSTQLACLCQEDLGAGCSVPNADALGVCPNGNWICVEGVDICEPEPECCVPGPCDTGLEGVCAVGEIVCDGTPRGTCVQTVFPTEEVCDLLDNDCDGEVDEGTGGDACTVPGGLGRCGEGAEECINGALQCVPNTAMPELCNGLDDDCDGMTDNLSESWDKRAFASIRAGLNNSGKAAACNFLDVCVCPNGPDVIEPAADFSEHLASYAPPVCECGEGLAPESSMTEDVEGGPATNNEAACSTAGGASGSLSILAVIGLLIGRRRRR